MVNQKQLDILKQGVQAWNEWRMEHPDIRHDLIGADLTEADLNNANLIGADLTEHYSCTYLKTEGPKANLKSDSNIRKS